jgi:hypothetical protein
VGAQPVAHLLQLGMEISNLGFELSHVHGVTASSCQCRSPSQLGQAADYSPFGIAKG